jgi:hypothetical protein
MEREFSDQRSCLEAIGQYLVDNAQEPYLDIDVKVELLDHGVVAIESFYRPERNPSAREAFDIEDAATEVDFGQCFVRLAELVSTPEKGLFKECKYRLKGDGSYTADYLY